MQKKSPDEELQIQKENAELKGTIDDLEDGIKDRDKDIIGFKETIKESQRQMEKFAIVLGVQNDYPVLLGEMEKLICVEDDVTELRGKMRNIKDEDEKEVVKAIDKGKRKVTELSSEVKQLKSRRNVDKYKAGELAKETMLKFLKSIFEGIKRLPRLTISKIRGVISSWRS